MPEMSYTIIKTTPTDDAGMPSVPGAINGGMFRREGTVTSPVVTVDVDDIDAALEKIEALGGSTVTPREEVGGMGWAAYFRDTEGNVVGLWQNAVPGGRPAPRRMPPGMTSAPDSGAAARRRASAGPPGRSQRRGRPGRSRTTTDGRQSVAGSRRHSEFTSQARAGRQLAR